MKSLRYFTDGWWELYIKNCQKGRTAEEFYERYIKGVFRTDLELFYKMVGRKDFVKYKLRYRKEVDEINLLFREMKSGINEIRNIIKEQSPDKLFFLELMNFRPQAFNSLCKRYFNFNADEKIYSKRNQINQLFYQKNIVRYIVFCSGKIGKVLATHTMRKIANGELISQESIEAAINYISKDLRRIRNEKNRKI